MKSEKGFTLIELLIVVAIIGIIAAIAIPSLLRARISANEANAIGDTRTIVSSSVTYQAGNGSYEKDLACMSNPVGCQWPAKTSQFLDPSVGTTGTAQKQGYNRTFATGSTATGLYNIGANVYTYSAVPITSGATGTRYFATDHSGVICQSGTAAIAVTASGLPSACTPI